MLAWWRKLASLLRRDAIDSELEEEMRTHLEMKASTGGPQHEPAASHLRMRVPSLLARFRCLDSRPEPGCVGEGRPRSRSSPCSGLSMAP